MNPRVPVEVQRTSDWNPSLYMKFEDERMLAARDLLARVPLASARLVYDLGCGPGNSAELLSRRFPEADITGLDTSEAMLDHARMRAPRARFAPSTRDFPGFHRHTLEIASLAVAKSAMAQQGITLEGPASGPG